VETRDLTGLAACVVRACRQEMSVFARHAGGLRCLAWVPEVPGGFVTVSDRNGVIRMWNVSQTAPVELLKTGKDGFHSIYFVTSDVALCAFKDGMVSVYNTSRKQVHARRMHDRTHAAMGTTLAAA
jgi:WD40 repeat protein